MTEQQKRALVYMEKDLEKAQSLDLDIVNTDRYSVITALNYIKELEEELEVCSGAMLISTEFIENNYIHKNILRKIKANTDTYRDFTEEVIKLL